MKHRIFHITLATLAAVIVAIIAVSMTWPVLNVVETGKTPEYAHILPQYYSTEPQRVFDESAASAQALPGWTVITQDRTTLTLTAERTTRLMGFVDDITIKVEPVTEFATRVHLKSASRIGKGDFGQNARNIQEFFGELDRRLGAVKFDPRAQQQ